ncbi:riboflavin biosynthesis protein RibF [Limosilactobacillus difficilis]|uniref:riboflavin biosynthesis protein RibF n=1 Tax=Limosilactobacillus difficilis TaxID=2991838 RepID=UPI0024BB19FF|nr:riboflavin biosynthesis protein RibF [Limosilactobacillus difficilis]
MEIIKLHHPLKPNLIPAGPVILAMGFFDGVHRGHQAVIRRAKEEAMRRHVPLAVLTYNHSPQIVYRRFEHGIHYLTGNQRKYELFERLGVDRVYQVAFTSDFGAQNPQEFVDHYLVALHPLVVVAGFDHTYGPGESATMKHLPDYARGRFAVITVPKLAAGIADEKVGSTQIKQAIRKGNIGQANQALGYHYQTGGLVVHGFARGRQIGFPTLNIDWPRWCVLPKTGVYVTRVLVNGTWYGGMANIGYDETFGDDANKTLEIFLFDFHHEVYGEKVRVKWYQRLRDTVKFNSIAALVKQMKCDQAACLAYLRDNK